MTEELKPCPFCGGEAYLDDDGWFQVICENCRACVRLENNRSDAVAAWNRRVLDDAVKQILQQLSEAN